MAGEGTEDNPKYGSYETTARSLWDKPLTYIQTGTALTISRTVGLYNYGVMSISGDISGLSLDDNNTVTGTVTLTGDGVITVALRHWTLFGHDDLTVTLQIVRYPWVTWVNDNGEILQAASLVKTGTVPVYNGPTPEKEDEVHGGVYYEYTFSGNWSPAVGAITNDTTYVAVYFANARRDILFNDDCPFVVIFDPAGGKLQDPGWFNQYDLTLPSSTVGSIAYDLDRGFWVWYYDGTNARNATSVTVTITNLPYSPETGLIPPEGINLAEAWSIATPYETSAIADSVCTFELTLKRASLDGICQKTAYPEWVPERTDQQRAFLMAPGYGSIDLGHIQSITEKYSSKVIQTPIVVYGFKKAFCMDIGVTRQIDLQYTRTPPAVPDDLSGDSRDWSNAYWITKLKDIMDRWQMRTDGNRLYILRPRNESEPDPMVKYYDEINGLNCYISQVPIKYDEIPHVLRGSISLLIGTLYPKQREPTQRQVSYINGDGVAKTFSTAGRWLSLPSANILWPPLNNLGKIYGDWEWIRKNDDGTQSTVSSGAGTVIDMHRVVDGTFTAKVLYDGAIHTIFDDSPGTRSVTLTKALAGQNIIIAAMCVGGGGGGGCGRIATYTSGTIITSTRYYVSGGGGGGSGGYYEQHVEIGGDQDQQFTLRYTVGAGGEGGTNPHNDYNPGNPGGDSRVWIDSTSLDVLGGGGAGGEGGSATWEDNESRVAQGGLGGTGRYQAKGGKGGQRGHDAEGGGSPSTPLFTGGGGSAYPDKYFNETGLSVGPSSGNSGDYKDCDGIDVGGGGGGASWCETTAPNKTTDDHIYDNAITPASDFPYAGRGGDGAYFNSPAGNGIFGGGGGGGGGAKRVSGSGYDGRYRVYPGGNGGNGYVMIHIAGIKSDNS